MKRTISSALLLIIIFQSNSQAADTTHLNQLVKDLALKESTFFNAPELPQKRAGLSLEEELTMGELALIDGCKKGDRSHAKKLVLMYKINPNIKDSKTRLSPFLLAIHTDRNLAAFLLGSGVKPHAHLDKTKSLYSESFRRGDTKAIQFVLRKHIPYITKKNHSNLARCRKEDLRRLLIAGNFIPLCQAFISGLLTQETITPETFMLACRLKDDSHFDTRIIPYLRKITSTSTPRFGHLKKKKA